MQSSIQYPYDDDAKQIVHTLNTEAGRTVAWVIDNPNIVYESLSAAIPLLSRGRGIDWESAVSCSGPFPGDPTESSVQLINRILADFASLREVAQLSENDMVSFISDDFYSIGIECEVSCAPAVLKSWVLLPQAIFVYSKKELACLHITFSRTSYVFQRCGRMQLVKPDQSGKT